MLFNTLPGPFAKASYQGAGEGEFKPLPLNKTYLLLQLRKHALAVAVAAVLICLGGFAIFSATRTLQQERREVRLALPFQTGGVAENFLFFPPGSKPEIQSLTIKNVGTRPARFPRIVINEKNPFGSMDEILDSCRKRFSKPEAAFLCLSQLLYDNLEHTSARRVGGDSMNFPATVLEALNYYGYTQCGPSSEYLVQLAEHAGYEACTLGFGGHVVAEIDLDGNRVLLDSDRNLFYTDDRFDDVLSFREVQEGTHFENTLGEFGDLSPIMVELNRLIFQKTPKWFCEKRKLDTFPLERAVLAPEGTVVFTRDCEADGLGCKVIWKGIRTLGADAPILLPYPGLSLRLNPRQEGEVLKGKLVQPFPQSFDSVGREVVIDLAGDVKKISRVFKLVLEMDPDTPQPVSFEVEMRYARIAVPDLSEGVNTFRLATAGPDEEADILVDIHLSTSVNESLNMETEVP